jgi:hypothetical protein
MGLLVENDLPIVRGIDTGKNLNQCAFTTAVLTGKAMDLPGKNREVDVVESANPTETLAYAEHFDKCRCCPGLVMLKLAHSKCAICYLSFAISFEPRACGAENDLEP